MSPTNATADRTGRCTFLGAGPGDPGLLTLRAVEVLATADILVADPLTAAAVHSHCPESVQLHNPVAMDAESTEFDAASLTKLIGDAVTAGKHVVRTVDGDPGLDGRAAEEMLACAKAGLPFEVIPGVAQSVGVPAYAGVRCAAATAPTCASWTARRCWRLLVDLGAPETTLVVRTTLGQLPATAGALVNHGRKPDAPLCATLSGTTTRQRTFTSTLATIGADLKAARVLPAPVSAPVDPNTPVIAVVGEQVAHRSSHSWFETKPLFGWNVLVPRTKEQAHGLSEQLRSYGAVPQEVPTIAVEPPRTPQQMERAIKGLVTGRYEWIAFTSVNAVRAVREKFEEYGLDARAFAGIKVAAVGETTAQALIDFGVKPDLVPSGEQSAAGLLEDWPPYDPVFDPIDRVLLPRADIATETLVAGLVELGWEVDDVTAYRTVRASPPPAETREAIKGGGFDAVLFTSSSTVRNLVGIAASRTTSPSSPVSVRPPPRPPRSTACGST